MTTPHPGLKLADRFTLLEPLRRGSGASLWLAHDEHRDHAVAIKFGPPDEIEKTFARMRAAAHPSVVVAQETGLDGEHGFLVMEHIEGEELSRFAGADYRRWLPVLRPVFDALTRAHAKGVVHGDIKLENVLSGTDGRARLVDFGPGVSAHNQAPGAVSAPQPADDVFALGVLMYELAAGAPPAAVHPLPPPTPPRGQPLPTALQNLILGMMHTDASRRPTVSAAAAAADAVLRGATESGAPDRESFEHIAPIERSATQPVTPSAPAARHPGTLLVLIAVLAVSASLLAVWLFARGNGDPATRETARAERPQLDPAEARLAAQRKSAEDARESVYAKWLQLEGMDARRWAQRRVDRALELLAEGERLLSEFDHRSATRLLLEADELMTSLLAEAPIIAADAREAGWQAFRAGDALGAAEHFLTVLAIEPGDSVIRDAHQRTQSLDRVNELLRAAVAHEAAGQLRAARDSYQRAVELDPLNDDAGAAVKRLGSQLATSAFERTMSSVHAAIAGRDYAAARTALARAEQQRPGAREIADARTQLDIAARTERIESLRAQALEAEGREDWDTAIEHYETLLAIDEAFVFAREGRDRARRLGSLLARVAALMAERDKLGSTAAQRSGAALVEQVAAVSAPAPQLRARGDELGRALALARQPVTVRLKSDNFTDVTIYRVGRLGAFDRHELQLVPGTYTVVGKCNGYRDVLTELVVTAGAAPDPLTVRCEEKI